MGRGGTHTTSMSQLRPQKHCTVNAVLKSRTAKSSSCCLWVLLLCCCVLCAVMCCCGVSFLHIVDCPHCSNVPLCPRISPVSLSPERASHVCSSHHSSLHRQTYPKVQTQPIQSICVSVIIFLPKNGANNPQLSL